MSSPRSDFSADAQGQTNVMGTQRTLTSTTSSSSLFGKSDKDSTENEEYRLANGVNVHFLVPEVETLYMQGFPKRAASDAKNLTLVVSLLIGAILICILLYRYLTYDQDSFTVSLRRVSYLGAAIIPFTLARIMSEKYQEALLIFTMLLIQSCLLTGNPYRLEYLGILTDNDEIQRFDSMGYAEIPLSVRIVCRDYYNATLVLLLTAYFFSLSSVRSKFSWLLSANVLGLTCVNHGYLTPKHDYEIMEAESYVFRFGFACGGLLFWSASLYRERKDRKTWALMRQLVGESETLERLLRLNFPSVVRVREPNGRIEATDDFVSLFGPDVTSLGDLTTIKDGCSDDTEFSAFVRNVSMSGLPEKRRFVFPTPHSGDKIDCTVCATNTSRRGETLLGFFINETSPINTEENASIPQASASKATESAARSETSRSSRVTFDKSAEKPGAQKASNLVLPRFLPKELRYIDTGPFSSDRGFRATARATPVDLWFRGASSGITSGRGDGRDSNDSANSSMSPAFSEAQFLATCRHPSILQVIGTVTLQSGNAFVMERSACSLASYLYEGPMSPTPAVRILWQVSSAISYLHDLGICYCVMDPKNVVLMQRVLRDPIAKLSNFSHCERKSKLFVKDITDFGVLMYRVLVSGSENQVTSMHDVNKQVPPLDGLERSYPRLAAAVQEAWEGGVSASRLATHLSDLDTALSRDCSFFSV
jgi:hypothetical protein